MYQASGFQQNRGIFNCNASAAGTSVMHSYSVLNTQSPTDTFAEITTPGYFPSYFSEPLGNILVGDILSIIGSDTNGVAEIESLNPVILIFEDVIAPSSFTFTWVGTAFATPQTSTMTLSKINGLVTLAISRVPATTFGTSSIIGAPADTIPAAFMPPSTIFDQAFIVTNNAIQQMGGFSIDADGSIGVFSTISSSTPPFTGPGAVGFSEISISYFV